MIADQYCMHAITRRRGCHEGVVGSFNRSRSDLIKGLKMGELGFISQLVRDLRILLYVGYVEGAEHMVIN